MKKWKILVYCIIILSCFLLYLFFFEDIKNNSINQENLLYDWPDLRNEYGGLKEDSLIQKLGNPEYSVFRQITGPGSIGPWGGLHRFQKIPADTVIFKELFWKQGVYDFYIWLLPKDSIWRAVDGVKYDPERVQVD